MMTLQSLSEFPEPEIEPRCDWAILSRFTEAGQALYLSYAVKRDFLSVPRNFVVVTFIAHGEQPLEIHQMDRAEYFHESQLQHKQTEPGLYQLSGEEEDLLLFIGDHFVLEIACDELRMEKTQYHQQDATQALLEWFSHSTSAAGQ